MAASPARAAVASPGGNHQPGGNHTRSTAELTASGRLLRSRKATGSAGIGYLRLSPYGARTAATRRPLTRGACRRPTDRPARGYRRSSKKRQQNRE
ncbi:hypothetical protein NL676_012198 [Syzygium grande]|nr:hypothetical protein NL676_012198 [Syzygium grande]